MIPAIFTVSSVALGVILYALGVREPIVFCAIGAVLGASIFAGATQKDRPTRY